MLDIVITAAYILILIGIGLRGGKAVRNADDFTATGNRYGAFVIFASLSASFIGGGYSSGNAAAAYESGISTALTLMGFSVGMIATGKWLVRGVARFPGARTVGDIMGAAYGQGVRKLTGIFSYSCCVGMIGAQMGAIGLTFHSLLGVSPTVGTIIGCGIVLIYTTFGGLQSVVFADLIQFVLLFLGMPFLLMFGIWKCGGIDAVSSALPDQLLSPLGGKSVASFVSLFFSMMCGEALAPPYMQRLLIGKSVKKTARGTVAAGIFSIPFFLVTAGIGLVAKALDVADSAAAAMPDLIVSVLPVGLKGLLTAAMVSVILSAADGFLNGGTVSLVCDTILPSLPPLSDKAQLRWLRIVNLATGVMAMAVSFFVPNVLSVLLLAYSFWSPAVLVPLCASLLGFRCDKRWVLAAMGVGCTVCFLWNTVLNHPWGTDGCIVGILANLTIVYMGYRYDRRTVKVH